MSSRKIAALLVGINKYPAPNALQGCVPDIQHAYAWLGANRGLSTSSTRILLDGTATRSGILGGLNWLAAQDADIALFYYSGHGTRVRDLDGDESTGFDQAIVPVDFNRSGLILDDDLQRQFLLFPIHTRIVMLLDSCYSDRADRSFAQSIKGAYYKYSGKRKARMIEGADLDREVLQKTYSGITRGWRAPVSQRDVVELAGCRDFETSADAYLGKKDGYRGAFSYSVFDQALKSFGPNATYQQAIEESQRRLSAGGYTQISQLSGPKEWLKAPIFT